MLFVRGITQALVPALSSGINKATTNTGDHFISLCFAVSSPIIIHCPVVQNIFHMHAEGTAFYNMPQVLSDRQRISFLLHKKAFAGFFQKSDRHGFCFCQMLFIRHIPIFLIGNPIRKISPVFISVKKIFPARKHFFLRHFRPDIAFMIKRIQNRHFIYFGHISDFN